MFSQRPASQSGEPSALCGFGLCRESCREVEGIACPCIFQAIELLDTLTLAQSDNPDDEFLGSRILFLMTYDTKLDFDPLFDEYHLGDSINEVSTSINTL